MSPQAATGRHGPPQAAGRPIKAVGKPSDRIRPISSRSATGAR
jgi:hypothetical protein